MRQSWSFDDTFFGIQPRLPQHLAPHTTHLTHTKSTSSFISFTTSDFNLLKSATPHRHSAHTYIQPSISSRHSARRNGSIPHFHFSIPSLSFNPSPLLFTSLHSGIGLSRTVGFQAVFLFIPPHLTLGQVEQRRFSISTH